jgi:hypothetical protein
MAPPIESPAEESLFSDFYNLLGHTQTGGMTALVALYPTKNGKSRPALAYAISGEEILSFANKHNGKAQCYLSVNPVKANIDASKNHTDADITHVCNIVFDVDVDKHDTEIGEKEIKEYAATDVERVDVINKADKVEDLFKSKGWYYYRDISGNGVRFLLAIPPIEVTDDNREDLRNKLKKLQRFVKDETGIDIDTSVHDFRRITGIPGTLNLKKETATRSNKMRVPSLPIPPRKENQQLREFILSLDGTKDVTKHMLATPDVKKSPNLTDDEVISKLMSSKIADKFETLWKGDTSAFDSDESVADYHLAKEIAFYTQKPEQIESIMRRSKLVRDKWNKRDDYLIRTIERAIHDLTATFNPEYKLEGTTEGDWLQVLKATPRPAKDDSTGERIGAAERFTVDHMGLVDPIIRAEAFKNEIPKHFGISKTAAKELLQKHNPKIKEKWQNTECQGDQKQEDSHGEETPAHIKKQALEIAEHGDPLKFIISTHQTLHVGDIGLANTLLLSCTNQSVLNSRGLQPKGSGGSGKGKTHCYESMGHLLPPEHFLNASLSNKAIYYMGKRLKSGVIIFSDDVNLSEEMEGIIKRATTFYQTGDTYITLDINRKRQELHIPPRIVWWLTSVDDDQSIQLLNRTFGGEVDESPEQDARVVEHELKLAKTGEVGLPLNDDVLTCREIIRDIKNHLYKVIIPFADALKWRDPANRRNLPILNDLIRAYAVLRHRQRERNEDGALLADLQDFVDAELLYSSRAEAQGTKLTSAERKLCEALRTKSGEMTYHELAEKLKVGETRITQILRGKTPGSGLLSKVTGLHVIPKSEKNNKDGYTQRNYVILKEGYNPLAGYEKVISIDLGAYPTYPDLTPTLPFENVGSRIEFTIFTYNYTTHSTIISNQCAGELDAPTQNGEEIDLSLIKGKEGEEGKNLTLDSENKKVRSGKVEGKKGKVNFHDSENQKVNYVFSECRKWEEKNELIVQRNLNYVVKDIIPIINLPISFDDLKDTVKKYAEQSSYSHKHCVHCGSPDAPNKSISLTDDVVYRCVACYRVYSNPPPIKDFTRINSTQDSYGEPPVALANDGLNYTNSLEPVY